MGVGLFPDDTQNTPLPPSPGGGMPPGPSRLKCGSSSFLPHVPWSLRSEACQVGFSDARERLRASFSVLQRKTVKESLMEIHPDHLGSA